MNKDYLTLEGIMFLTNKDIKRHICNMCLLLGAGLVPALGFAQTESQQAEKAGKANPEDDLIRLESTFVGDKEQPSVSYFIPWKGTDSADGLRWQLERKNDDTLNLVDRDIMLRSINIYNEMKLE
jgi:hypothetical protein